MLFVVAAAQLVSYDLTRRDCLHGAFPGGVFGALLRKNASCLANGNGVSRYGGGYVVSERNASAFAAAMRDSDGMTVELWLQPGHSLSHSYQPLLAVGRVPVDVPSTCAVMTGLRMHLSTGGDLYVEYAYDSGDGQPRCMVALTGPVLAESLTYYHLAVILGDDMRVYVNGTLVFAMEPFVNYAAQRYDLWDHGNFHLGLFADASFASSSDTADGAVHALRIHSRSLSGDDILVNYAANIANSLPVVSDVVVVVNEDGEAGPVGQSSLSADLYANELPWTALAVVVLDAYDADDQPRHPNQRDPLVREHPMRVFIETAPKDKTRLYTATTGLPLYDGDEVPRDDAGQYSVLVRPPLNVFGTTIDFSFVAVDGVTGESSSTATVTAEVVAVNDPPFLDAGRVVDAYAGATTIIALSGSDAEGDEIVSARVVELPSFDACLYRVVNGSVGDSLLVGDEIQGGLVVAYKYHSSVDPGTVLRDGFSVKLADAEGAVGSAGNVTVLVTSSMVASVTTQVVLEDERSSVTLNALDASDAHLDVCVTIAGLSHGVLAWDSTTNSSLRPGDALASRGTDALVVDIKSAPDLFTTPATRWNGSALAVDDVFIDFEAFACDEPTVRSVVTRQAVDVRNVADAANLTATANDLSIYALPVQPMDDDDFPTLLRLGRDAGLVLTDPDRDVDLLHVLVETTYGLVSLDEDRVGIADFNSHAYCFSNDGGPRNWACDGTGTKDKYMSFVATPSEAATLLAGLLYEGHYPNNDDTVTVSVYDGASQDDERGCLDEGQYKTLSVRAVCAVSAVALRVRIKETASYASDLKHLQDANDGFKLPWQVFLALVAVSIVFCCIGCRACRRSRRRRAERRRRKRAARETTDDAGPFALPKRFVSARLTSLMSSRPASIHIGGSSAPTGADPDAYTARQQSWHEPIL